MTKQLVSSILRPWGALKFWQRENQGKAFSINCTSSWTLVQASLRDIAGLVLDYRSKARANEFIGFPVQIKVRLILYYGLL